MASVQNSPSEHNIKTCTCHFPYYEKHSNKVNYFTNSWGLTPKTTTFPKGFSVEPSLLCLVYLLTDVKSVLYKKTEKPVNSLFDAPMFEQEEEVKTEFSLCLDEYKDKYRIIHRSVVTYHIVVPPSMANITDCDGNRCLCCWHDKDKVRHKIVEMDTRYLCNVYLYKPNFCEIKRYACIREIQKRLGLAEEYGLFGE